MQRRFPHIVFVLYIVAAAFTGCRMIDEDLSDCGKDFTLDCEVKLVTNMTAELKTELSLDTEISVAKALEAYLEDIFTDFAHDVDLSFYDVQGDSVRLHHEQHIMDASESSYTLYIPVREYMHLAAANLEKNGDVVLERDEKCHAAALVQNVGDTILSHRTGLYSARLPMEIMEGKDQEFDVKLYMANSASALVLDTLGSGIRDIKVFASGFATRFNLADSTYHFEHSPIVKADKVTVEDAPDAMLCYAAVTFPSRDVQLSKVRIDTDDEDVTVEAAEALWTYRVYVLLADGSVTETILGVKVPLRPGRLKVVKGIVLEDGSCVSCVPYVGASVALNWNEMPIQDVPL